MVHLCRHVIAEVYDCSFEKLNDRSYIEDIMVKSIIKGGAHIEKVVFKEFPGQGLSGVIVISESHVTIHTWPEYGYAAIDAFTCGDDVSPYTICENITQMLGGNCKYIKEFKRGFVDKELFERFREEDACSDIK